MATTSPNYPGGGRKERDGSIVWDRRGAKELIYIVHGFRRKPVAMAELCTSIAERNSRSDVVVPSLAHSSTFSRTPAWRIALNIVEHVGRLHDLKGYKTIRFVGHSMGGLLARRAIAIAKGETKFSVAKPGYHVAPFELELVDAMRGAGGDESPIEARSWAGAVDRLVLLAGMNTGWSVDSPMSMMTSVIWNIGSALGHIWEMLSPERYGLTIFDIRRGAPFVVQTRLQWMALRKTQQLDRVTVVQLLGTQDDFVSPQQDVDRIVDKGSRRFRLIDVPATDHGNIISIQGKEGAVRLERILAAISGSDVEIKNIVTNPDHYFDTPPPVADQRTEAVVFVIHGIRDRGYWTSRIAAAVKRQAVARRSAIRIESETSSYGYFAMAPFILPWIRRQKVEWLMDLYVGKRAHYPRAKFQYVGHSNGTYLLARALQEYQCCSFENVVFAGSVVRRDFWQMFATGQRGKRVSAVLNYVATGDWVVTFFPHGLEWLKKVFDLGGAGYLGFLGQQPNVLNLHLVRGSHSAAIQEQHWPDIADFVLDGPNSHIAKLVNSGHLPVNQMFSRAYDFLIRVFGPFAPLAPIAALAALVVPPILAFVAAIYCNSAASAVALTAAGFLWAMLAKFVVTRL